MNVSIASRVLASFAAIAALAMTGCGSGGSSGIADIHIACGSPANAPIASGFKSKMAELGYEEGKNIRFHDISEKTGSPEEREALDRAVAGKAKLILAFPTGTAMAAKSAAAGKVPVIFGMANIEGTDLVADLRKPGGRITGLRAPTTEAVLKRFEYLRMLLPRGARIYTAYDPEYPANKSVLPEIRKAARESGVALIEARIKGPAELRADLEARKSGTDLPQGVLITADSLTQSPEGWAMIRDYARERRIPISAASAAQAEEGAAICFAVDFAETGRLAAVIADKVLKGADAGGIPVATAGMALVVNLRVAEDSGFAIPPELLNLASRIIR